MHDIARFVSLDDLADAEHLASAFASTDPLDILSSIEELTGMSIQELRRLPAEALDDLLNQE